MNIGIDYDETFTSNPEMFREIIRIFSEYGHNCYIVTARSEERCEKIEEEAGIQVISTGQKAKAKACFNECIDIDIWIDDFPFSVCFDMEKKYELNPA